MLDHDDDTLKYDCDAQEAEVAAKERDANEAEVAQKDSDAHEADIA